MAIIRQIKRSILSGMISPIIITNGTLRFVDVDGLTFVDADGNTFNVAE